MKMRPMTSLTVSARLLLLKYVLIVVDISSDYICKRMVELLLIERKLDGALSYMELSA